MNIMKYSLSRMYLRAEVRIIIRGGKVSKKKVLSIVNYMSSNVDVNYSHSRIRVLITVRGKERHSLGVAVSAG